MLCRVLRPRIYLLHSELSTCVTSRRGKMDLTRFSGLGDAYLHLRLAERYIQCPKETYIPPPIPVKIPQFDELQHDDFKFGHDCRRLFYLSKDVKFLNHGALGCALKASLEAAQEYQRYIECQPMSGIDREQVPLICHITREMAAFVNCEPQDLVLIENASAGTSTVLRSLQFGPGDTILTLSLGYGAVRNAVNLVCGMTGAKHTVVKVELPIDDMSSVVDKVKDSLHSGVKLAVFDHLPSGAACVLPIRELSQLCHDRGVKVLIDGAHSLGQVKVDLNFLDVDFYVSTCHKWFSNVRGSAILYVRRELQPEIRPLVVSWGHNKGFSAEFAWSSTRDYSPYVGLLSTINFWRSAGVDRITSYCHDLLQKAELLCRTGWKVPSLYPSIPFGSMALVQLPDQLNDSDWIADGSKRHMIQDCLRIDHNIETTIRLINGVLYIRLSCFIYNELSDYARLRDAVLDICDKKGTLFDHSAIFRVK